MSDLYTVKAWGIDPETTLTMSGEFEVLADSPEHAKQIVREALVSMNERFSEMDVEVTQ